MAKLAIRGHETRGEEVIRILEMLGGENINVKGGDVKAVYLISTEGTIETHYTYYKRPKNYNVFTLEEFLEKFPYKVGDKVQDLKSGEVFRIDYMFWDKKDCTVYYFNPDIIQYYSAEELNKYNEPYKEKTMEERKIDAEYYFKVWGETEKGLEVFVNDDFELKEDNGKFYLVKKQPQYPKTFGECCKVLSWNGGATVIGYDAEIIENFQKLKLCRDAYWKIAGEQMGLKNPWKPDWENCNENKYCLYITKNNVTKGTFCCDNRILAFPTREMRDAFYENFKDLIEKCKELL